MARPDLSHQRRIETAKARVAEAEARLVETERRLRLAHEALAKSKLALKRLRKSGLTTTHSTALKWESRWRYGSPVGTVMHGWSHGRDCSSRSEHRERPACSA